MLGTILELLRHLFVFTGYVSRSLSTQLTKEDEKKLVERLLDGDEDARDKLIEHNLRLVAHIAKKFKTPGRDMDDLISIGSIGLIKAVNTYSPARGRSLASYAGRCIENAILAPRPKRQWIQHRAAHSKHIGGRNENFRII